MNIREVEKSSFSIIGKEGLGKAQEADIWIPPLWQEATNAFEEIIHLIKQPLTIWGPCLMNQGNLNHGIMVDSIWQVLKLKIQRKSLKIGLNGHFQAFVISLLKQQLMK